MKKLFSMLLSFRNTKHKHTLKIQLIWQHRLEMNTASSLQEQAAIRKEG